MDRPSNLREALLADALGDLHKLLDRADKLVPAIDEARKALEESREALVMSARGMAAEGEAMKRQALTEAEDTKKATLRYLGDNTKQLVAELVIRQTQAMSDTARSLVEKEVGPKLRDLATRLEKQANRANDPWRDWLAHAFTGALSSVCAASVSLLCFNLFAPGSRVEPQIEPPQTLQAPASEVKASTATPLSVRREKDKPSRGAQTR